MEILGFIKKCRILIFVDYDKSHLKTVYIENSHCYRWLVGWLVGWLVAGGGAFSVLNGDSPIRRTPPRMPVATKDYRDSPEFPTKYVMILVLTGILRWGGRSKRYAFFVSYRNLL